MYNNDTIAAISTPYGTGGIGVVRISGEKAFDIAGKIFKGKNPFEKVKTHTIRYGKIVDPEKSNTIDEVLIFKMQKPKSFTKEDVVEISCHGGTLVLKYILELVIRHGARLAEPGEFSKRAFLNGRIDLSQAEAVIDLINSKTEESSRAAVNQLEGKLSKKITETRKKLIELIAHIEVTVDYPEHDIEEITGEKVYLELKTIEKKLKKIIEGFERGRVIREGISVVIIGKPNVGKSSLLNELSGKTRAIVTNIPGTTRDIIEEYINIKGIPVRIVDTAGIRETDDVVEKIGVESAKKAVEDADLAIMMIDAADGVKDEDMKLLDEVKRKKHIIVINKIDLLQKGKEVEQLDKITKSADDEQRSIIKTSLKEDFGVDRLEEEITRLFIEGEISTNSEYLVTNVRHKNAIDRSIESVNEAINAYKNKMPLDFITIDIKNAAEFLGSITGETVSEDVINEIFSRFCLGK